jgi:hypothetical protein
MNLLGMPRKNRRRMASPRRCSYKAVTTDGGLNGPTETIPSRPEADHSEIVESATGAVAVGRGSRLCRQLSLDVGASVSAIAPFPAAAHRAGRADFLHPALGRASREGMRGSTMYSNRLVPWAGRSRIPTRIRSSRDPDGSYAAVRLGPWCELVFSSPAGERRLSWPFWTVEMRPKGRAGRTA